MRGTIHVTLRLPIGLVEEIDAQALKEMRSRSQVILRRLQGTGKEIMMDGVYDGDEEADTKAEVGGNDKDHGGKGADGVEAGRRVHGIRNRDKGRPGANHSGVEVRSGEGDQGPERAVGRCAECFAVSPYHQKGCSRR